MNNKIEEDDDEEKKIAKENKLSDMDYLRSKIVFSSQKTQKMKKSKKAQNVDNDDSDNEKNNNESSDKEITNINRKESDNDDDGDDDDDSDDDDDVEGEDERHDSSKDTRSSPEKETAKFGTIKMRGLPFKAKENHIRDFFASLRLLDIRMIKNTTGKPTGCAFVDFASENDIKEALKRNKDCIEGRYIELFRDKQEQLNQRIIKEKPWMKKLAGKEDDEEFESIAEVLSRFNSI